jgi:hypothetical protein
MDALSSLRGNGVDAAVVFVVAVGLSACIYYLILANFIEFTTDNPYLLGVFIPIKHTIDEQTYLVDLYFAFQ